MHFLVILLGFLIVPAYVQAQDARSKSDLSSYAVPTRLVDIGGRRLNLICLGSGKPTVVLETQLGEAAWNWAPVHSELAKHVRACVYDRAGLGFSDPSGRPGTSANAAEDLAELLRRAQEQPPYLLVGASYGSLIVRYFAAKHSKDVAGLVLVDGHHEDDFTRINQLSAGKYALMMESMEQSYRQCVAASLKQITPGSAEYNACVGPPPAFANRSITAAHLAQLLSSKYWISSLSEWENLNRVSSDQIRALQGGLRNVPILALIRTISPFDTPGKPASTLSKAVERENTLMQEETARLSNSGATRIVPGAGHTIHLDKPAAVVKAVLDTAAQVNR
jgi:pimeloyl-ACP methyl ester carboxylesterase